ncbi:MAG: cytochrome c-type biogenesis protein CcmH [Gammaproteobacteria bacterium]|nr:cytochrome c-type biogenesis protein CcmH [Gammaproteobacteria bacterium]
MRHALILSLAAVLLSCLWLPPARAVDSEPPFSNPQLQQRYENLIHEFRCLVCFDESIANSDADLAADFRRQVHQMVAQGKSDRQIKDFMADRYGDFVLYQPPVQPNTWLLWGGPFLLLLIALVALAFILRRRAHMDTVDGEEGS